MALVLTITTGRIARERTEAFQVTFRNLLSRRFEEASFLRQAMLVHLGDGVWQMHTLWETTLAQNHTVDNDVPLTLRIFRDFGTEPEILLADVSSFLQPPPALRPTVPGETTIAQRLDSAAAQEGSADGATET